MGTYKGIRIDNGERVYGWHVKTNSGDRIIVDGCYDEDVHIHFNEEDNGYLQLCVFEVHPDSVVQKTGQQDENKKDIYNGDEVFICGYNKRGKVYYCEVSFHYRISCKEVDTALCQHKVFIIEEEKNGL